MIDTIVFDIGNVLAHFCWEDYLVDCGYSQEVIDKVSKATVLSPLWNELDRGARKEEEIFVFIKELAASQVTVGVRIWAYSSDYWDVYFRLNENFKKAFDKAQIKIPLNRLSVHIEENK